MRIQGGTNGLLAALDAGRLDPLSGEVLEPRRPWRPRRRNWYENARVERVAIRDAAKEERRVMGRKVLSIPDLVPSVPF